MALYGSLGILDVTWEWKRDMRVVDVLMYVIGDLVVVVLEGKHFCSSISFDEYGRIHVRIHAPVLHPGIIPLFTG